MNKDNKGFRPMSDDNDMPQNSGKMSDIGMKQGNSKMPGSGMMPESNMKPYDDMMSKGGKMPKSGMMPSDNMMPKSGMMPNDNMMPKSGMMPNDNMMPKGGMMPNDNMMPGSAMTKYPANPNDMNKVQGEEMQYKALYPEVFYKVQPYIMMVCDELENMGEVAPTQEMLDNISDNIYEDVREMYPEMSDYIEQTDAAEPVILGYGRRFGRPFRRRGIFRDLVGILLLSELFGRRRRRYW